MTCCLRGDGYGGRGGGGLGGPHLGAGATCGTFRHTCPACSETIPLRPCTNTCFTPHTHPVPCPPLSASNTVRFIPQCPTCAAPPPPLQPPALLLPLLLFDERLDGEAPPGQHPEQVPHGDVGEPQIPVDGVGALPDHQLLCGAAAPAYPLR